MKVYVLNGPNLGRLGTRQTDVYGLTSYADLVDLCEEALSAPTFELLKRGDEGALVLQAHAQPRFVEDVVREALHLARQAYGGLGDLGVFASSEAEESIHKHNAYAERRTTLGAL